MGCVVVLNGASSVGKSSLAAAIQRIARADVLLLAMDTFLAMLSPQTFGTPDGLSFLDAGTEGLEVRSGALVRRVLDAMRVTAAHLAGEGATVLVDDVMLRTDDEAAYRALLPADRFVLIGLHAPLDVIEERERQRGDRAIGLARWQVGRVHAGRRYDLEIDTDTMAVQDAARLIRDTFDL